MGDIKGVGRISAPSEQEHDTPRSQQLITTSEVSIDYVNGPFATQSPRSIHSTTRTALPIVTTLDPYAHSTEDEIQFYNAYSSDGEGRVDEFKRHKSTRIQGSQQSPHKNKKSRQLRDSKCIPPSEHSISPVDKAGWLSSLFLGWLSPLVKLGYSKGLRAEDVYPLSRHDAAKVVADRFDTAWSKWKDKSSRFRFLFAVFEAFGYHAITGFVFAAIFLCTEVMQPFIIRGLLLHLEGSQESSQDEGGYFLGIDSGYVLAALATVNAALIGLCSRQSFYQQTRFATRGRVALIDIVYRKTILLTSQAKASSSTGHVLTLASVDAFRIFLGLHFIQWLWLGPVLSIAAMTFLTIELGVSGLAGCAIIFLLMSLQGLAARLSGHYKSKAVCHTQERVKLISEALQGIRVIKMYAWEEPLRQRIQHERNEELYWLKRFLVVRVLSLSILFVLPAAVYFSTFSVYVAMGNQLTVSKVFTAMAWISALRTPIAIFPVSLSEFFAMMVSIKRVNEFLSLPEKKGEQGLPNDIAESQEDHYGTASESDGDEVPLKSVASITDRHEAVDAASLSEECTGRSHSEMRIETGLYTDLAVPGRIYSSTEKQRLLLPGEVRIANQDFYWDNPMPLGPDVASERGLQGCIDQKAKGPHNKEPDDCDISEGYPGFTDTPNPTLTGIDLAIKPGTLVGIVGAVGSGKSSLLSAIMGEMWSRTRGPWYQGKVGYVPQQPWIRNTSVKDNILLEDPIDKKRYKQVVKRAQLLADFELLPNRDSTEVGERGTNLSGGQKARLSLARAMYRADTDLIVLDDPLSAVDVHVAEDLFQFCVVEWFKNKTRFLVLNNHYDLLSRVDYMLVMDDGKIIRQGSPAELEDFLHDELSQLLKPPSRPSQSDDHTTLPELQTPNRHSSSDGQPRSLEQRKTHEASSIPLQQPPTQDNITLLGAQSGRKSRLTAPSSNSSFSEIDDFAEQRLPEEESDWAAASVSLREIHNKTLKLTGIAGCGHGEAVSVADSKSVLSSVDAATLKTLVEDESMDDGRVRASTYIEYFSSGAQRKRGFLLFFYIIFIFVLAQISRIVGDWFLGQWAEDRYAGLSQWDYGLILAALCLVATLLSLFRALLFVNSCLKAGQSLHHQALADVLEAPIPTFFDVTPVGRILNRFSKDMDQVDTIVPDYAMQLLQNILRVLGIMAVCAFTSAWILLMYLPIGVFFYIVQKRFRASYRDLKRLENVSRSPIFSSFTETLDGFSTIRFCNLQSFFVDRTRYYIDQNTRSFVLFWSLFQWAGLRLDLAAAAITGAVSVCCVAFQESISPALAGLALTYAIRLTGLLPWTVRNFLMTETSMTSAERLLEYKQIQSEAKQVSEPPLPTDWPNNGDLSLEDVWVRYRPNLPMVLRGVSMEIYNGEKIGICGRTGAGKSSVIAALFRIVEPERGSIYLAGRNIATLSLKDLRKSISVIPQDPVVFTGTIRYNLDPFGAYSESQLWEALHRVHLHQTIGKLELKLDAELSEGGSNFSGGQRQLLCIARAFLRNTKVIVMDEATANVDSKTDKVIQTTLRQNLADRTMIIIAHRLETILFCDRIGVFKDGRLIEFDTPQRLLKQGKSAFAASFRQMSNYIRAEAANC